VSAPQAEGEARSIGIYVNRADLVDRVLSADYDVVVARCDTDRRRRDPLWFAVYRDLAPVGMLVTSSSAVRGGGSAAGTDRAG